MTPPMSIRAHGVRGTFQSTALNTVVGIIGVSVPIIGFLTTSVEQRWLLLAVGVLAIGLALWGQISRSSSLEELPRPDPSSMSDSTFFTIVESDLLDRAKDQFRQLFDGHLSIWGSEVTRFYTLLWATACDSDSVPKRVLTLDLTTNPDILLTRADYHAVNKRYMESGGTIQRVFVCRRSDLLERRFATSLCRVATLYQNMGASLGLAVRDQLRPELVVDFVLFSGAAVIVEEEQASLDYVYGRCNIYFRHLDAYVAKFEEVWKDTTTPAAPALLQRYLKTVKSLLASEVWDVDEVSHAIARREEVLD